MSTWSKKISNYRLKLGHSRKKMALLIGISESSLRSYETDKRDPNYNFIDLKGYLPQVIDKESKLSKK